MPKIERIIQVALLIIVIGSVSYLIAKDLIHEFHNDTVIKEPSNSVTVEPADSNIKPDHIVAYYFHGNFRCASCKKIEAYSKESINSNFSNELKKGILLLKVINIEEPGNRHFIRDYNLYTKSLVVVSYAGDKQIKYKNLERVWDYLGSKAEFENYVRTELSGFTSEVGK